MQEGGGVKPYYDDGTCVIYHGEALKVLAWLGRAEGRGSVDVVLTDPPYIIGAASAGNLMSKSGSWSDMMNSTLWFAEWYRMVDRLLHRGGVFWTFLNWRSLPVVMRSAMEANLAITSMAVWDKQWIGPGGSQGLRPSYEMVALLCQPDYSIPDRGVPDIFQCQVGSYKEHGHPAEKPTRLVSRLLQVSGVAPGAQVLDPFLGSGTTAVAAKSLGLRCVGIEAEERYCEIAAKRLAQEVLDFGAVS